MCRLWLDSESADALVLVVCRVGVRDCLRWICGPTGCQGLGAYDSTPKLCRCARACLWCAGAALGPIKLEGAAASSAFEQRG